MVTPIFKILVNGEAIKNDDVISIEYYDRFEDGADQFSMDFSKVYTFGENDKLECWLGSVENGMIYIGEFVVNEVIRRKFTTSISATSLDFSSPLKEKKNRSFNETTIEQIVKVISKEHGLNVKTDATLSVQYIAQSNESDISFLMRVAKAYNLVFSIKNKTLIMLKKEESLPVFNLRETDCQEYEFHYSKREKYNSVEISWYDTKSHAMRKEIIGSKEPILKVSEHFKNRSEARSKAKAKLNEANKSTLTGTISTHGQNIIAGGLLRIDGIDGINEEFLIKEVQHQIHGSHGYNMMIAFEKYVW